MASTLVARLTGGASNSDPNASLGGVMSSTGVNLGTPLNNLFDNVQPDEAVAGDSEYRCIAIYNSGDADAVGCEAWLDTETTSADTDIQLWLEGVNPGTPLTVANESTAPTGSSFTKYTNGSRLTIPTIPAGQAAHLWLKRIVNASAVNIASDAGGLKVQYA